MNKTDGDEFTDFCIRYNLIDFTAFCKRCELDENTEIAHVEYKEYMDKLYLFRSLIG
jgi:hypothetical protein